MSNRFVLIDSSVVIDFDDLELIAFSDNTEQFSKLNATILACATESHLTHLQWLVWPSSRTTIDRELSFNRLNMARKEGGIHGLQIPLIADKKMEITKLFGVLNEDEGTAYRYPGLTKEAG